MVFSSTKEPSAYNQTSTFVESASGLYNSSYGNISSCGNMSSLVRPAYTGIYGYSYLGVLSVLVMMGIIGNILLFIMMTDKTVNVLSYSVYLKFLSLSDSMLLIIRLAHETERIFAPELLQQEYNFRWVLHVSSQQIVQVLSPWLVVGLSLDRFVCVCFPLKRGKLCTQSKATVICSILTCISVVLMLPISSLMPAGLCKPSQIVQYYYLFIRLVVSSTVPCFTILVLNILIIIHIRRSYKFRKTFTRSTQEGGNHTQDKATRPLVLVSLLAFVTLLPVSMSEAVEIPLEILQSDANALALGKKLWFIFVIIYVLNFGQNFYILIGSSSSYRSMIKRRLALCCVTKNQRTVDADTTNLSHISVSRSGTITVSVESTSCVNPSPALESV